MKTKVKIKLTALQKEKARRLIAGGLAIKPAINLVLTREKRMLNSSTVNRYHKDYQSPAGSLL